MQLSSIENFHALDLRVGTIIRAERFEKAQKPSILLWIDFGNLGIKKSSAQITALYQPEELIGKQIIALVNIPPRQIANIMSECLVLGAVDIHQVTLIQPEKPIKNGLKIS